MGTKQVKTSDISDIDVLPEDLVVVTVKDAGLKFDAHRDELKGLKAVTNVIELEFSRPGGQKETVLVNRTEFEKLVPKEKLRSNRGREKGYSPKVAQQSASVRAV